MGNVVGFSEFQKRFEAECLFESVYVLALQVFDALRFDCRSIRQFDDAHRHVFEFCEFGCSQTPRSGYHFIFAFVQFAYQERCENALRFEAGCQFAEAIFVKALTRIAGRLGESG